MSNPITVRRRLVVAACTLLFVLALLVLALAGASTQTARVTPIGEPTINPQSYSQVITPRSRETNPQQFS